MIDTRKKGQQGHTKDQKNTYARQANVLAPLVFLYFWSCVRGTNHPNIHDLCEPPPVSVCVRLNIFIALDLLVVERQ